MINKLYMGAAGSASLDFRDSGKITACAVSWYGAATGVWELSFNSSSQLTTNDATGTICTGIIAIMGSYGTISVNMSEAVDAGERIYLHVSGTGNVVSATIVTDAATVRANPRRR